MRTCDRKQQFPDTTQSTLREFDDRCPYHEGTKSYHECNCNRIILGKD